MADTFIKNISDAINRINEYLGTGARDESNDELIITIDGVRIEKNFTAEAISPLGRTTLSNLKAVFEEYNGALEPDEQLAILVKLISEIIH